MHQNRVVRLTSVSLFSILSAQNRIKYDRGVAVSVHGRIILLQNTPVFGSKGNYSGRPNRLFVSYILLLG